jgi:hypothetical protein
MGKGGSVISSRTGDRETSLNNGAAGEAVLWAERRVQQEKEKYFSGPNGVTTFALTVQVHGTDDWTPATLKDRQADLLNRLIAEWELDTQAG